MGTGWILDFELPEEGKDYPQTWYLGTTIETLKLIDGDGQNIDNNFEYDEYSKGHNNQIFLGRSPLDDCAQKKTQDTTTLDFEYINNPKVTFIGTNFLKTRQQEPIHI